MSFLKTLSGLERVDVILRRVDDDFCDPLELRNDSMLGVPGLVEALRAGNVVVANALGSGLLQSPAFMSFLPGLCRHLLGEELRLPSVATWWCGQNSAQQHVLENLDELVVKPAFRTFAKNIDWEKSLAAGGRDELKRRIEFDPDLFVAQEHVQFSTAPSLGKWRARGAAGRSARLSRGQRRRLSRHARRSYARFARAAAANLFPCSTAAAARIPGSFPNRPSRKSRCCTARTSSVELRRTGNNLPSRLADNFFWLGRYSERADATARLLRCALMRFNPERTGSALPLLAPLLQTLETQGPVARHLGNCRNCAKMPRRSRRNCSPRFLIPHAREVCAGRLIICSGSRCSCAIAPQTTCGAS